MSVKLISKPLYGFRSKYAQKLADVQANKALLFKNQDSYSAMCIYKTVWRAFKKALPNYKVKMRFDSEKEELILWKVKAK